MLVRTVKAALHGLDIQTAKPLVGRLVVTLGPKGGAQWDEIRARLSRIPGIGNFALATHVAPDLEAIAVAVAQAVASEPAPRSFRISARRADKRFGIPSPEIERVVGARVQAATGWKVDLSSPELVIGIEVLSADAFFYFRKEPGVGGLPIGTSGRVTCLLSGGIDSPVAAWRLIRRGCPRDVRALPQLSDPVAHVAGQGARAGQAADPVSAEVAAVSGAVRWPAAASRADDSTASSRRRVPAADDAHRGTARARVRRARARDRRRGRPGRVADDRESPGRG